MVARQELLGKFRDLDGTEKFVFKSDAGVIELTRIKNKKGIDVICAPTHHYCNLQCRFCHLTESGSLNLKMNKILAINLQEALRNVWSAISRKPLGLLSFMGVGEPFLNPDLIWNTYGALNNEYEKMSFALATMMPTIEPINYFMRKTDQGLPLKIHFSLHSSLDHIRSMIIPASKVTIDQCFRALADYRDVVSANYAIMENLSKFHETNSPVEIHYTVIDGINDSQAELIKLIEYGGLYQVPLKILKFNATKSLKRSLKEQRWFEVLSSEYEAPISMYSPPGPNIGSSCGQFTKHYYIDSNSEEELQEFERWKKKYQVFN